MIHFWVNVCIWYKVWIEVHYLYAYMNMCLLKRLSIKLCLKLCGKSIQTCIGLFLDSILFYSIIFFILESILCHDCCRFMINFEVRYKNFVLFNVIFAILVPLHFQMKFGITCQVLQKSWWNFDCNCVESIHPFWNYATLTKLSLVIHRHDNDIFFHLVRSF